MSEAVAEAPPRKGQGGKRPLIIGLVAAPVLAAAGFFVTWSGLVGGSSPAAAPDQPAALPDIAFLPIDPVVVSLPETGGAQHLRMAVQLEVASSHLAEVEQLRPRVADVLNAYLRAVDPGTLRAPGALVQIRAQLLRRVQIVTGEGRVRDLLVTEFVVS